MLLSKQFPIEEIDYNFLKSHLSRYKNVRVKINDMIKKREIIRIKKGLYILGDAYSQGYYHKETLSNLIYGPSYISLEYALSFYGLIPESTSVVTAVTNKRNKFFETPVGGFSYRYIAPALYAEGITTIPLDSKHNILIASMEKAMADTLYFSDTFENSRELQEYLFENLRIDEDALFALNLKAIKKLAKLYRGNTLLLATLLENNNE